MVINLPFLISVYYGSETIMDLKYLEIRFPVQSLNDNNDIFGAYFNTTKSEINDTLSYTQIKLS